LQHSKNGIFTDFAPACHPFARGFRGHARGGELAQLVVDERQEVGSRLAVARAAALSRRVKSDMTDDFIRHRRQMHRKTRVMVWHSRHWADTNSSTMSHSWPREV
jgi:hypothetical protein